MLPSKSEKNFLKKLGSSIAYYRKSIGLSQLDLCAKINMEKSNLSAIENGRQNVTTLTLLKITEALQIDMKSLFNFSEDNHLL
ncbi:helix-turn-helix transcriptional regulator [Leeuwenhoekiella aequorea]|uniref:helix-turn-helix domain-containing protein n=1 Tax=Leeuwenhoekiella aequorea TaxID=283736 RepID=UPI00352CEE44